MKPNWSQIIASVGIAFLAFISAQVYELNGEIASLSANLQGLERETGYYGVNQNKEFERLSQEIKALDFRTTSQIDKLEKEVDEQRQRYIKLLTRCKEAFKKAGLEW